MFSSLRSTWQHAIQHPARLLIIPGLMIIGFAGILTISSAQDASINLLGFHNTHTPFSLQLNATDILPQGAQIDVHPHQDMPDASVLINHQEVIHFRTRLGNDTPYERATKTAKRLHDNLSKHPDQTHIYAHIANNEAHIKLGKTILATIDEETATSAGNTIESLAITWTNLLQNALGIQQMALPDEVLPAGKFKQSGMASWYGAKFHGRRTANGSIYNMYEYTAAHKRLPFGSLVQVTNLKNNKTVIVKITDRGPFAHGRIIDLSKAAAEEIGLTRSGVAPVKIQTLNLAKTPYRLPAPAQPTSSYELSVSQPVAPTPRLDTKTEQTEVANVPEPKVNNPATERQVPVSFLDAPIAAPAYAPASPNKP